MSGAAKHDEARLRRRAGRLLAGLRSGGRLLRAADSDGASSRYELRVAGEAAPRLVVEAGLVEEMVRRDWLRPARGGSLQPTDAGRAFSARQMRPDEPFRAQHLALSVPNGAGSAPDAAAEVDNESPLAWLRRRKDAAGCPMISDAQYAAGERLRADFTRACLMPRVTADWSATPGRRRGGQRGDPAALMDVAISARTRVEHALEAVGPTLGGLLLDVCCFLTGLEEVERARGWARRSGKVVLGIALDRLADHYGISDEARGPESARLRHWGAEGYKPRV